MKRALMTLALLACMTPVWAQAPAPGVSDPSPAIALTESPVRLTSHIDRTAARLGETVVLTVDVTWPAALDVRLPSPDALDFSPLEVRDAVMTPQPVSEGRKAARYTVRLAGYEPGRRTVRPLEVSYKQPDDTTRTVGSPPLEVTIERASTVPAPPAAASGAPAPAPAAPVEIRELKAMEDIPTPLWMTALVIGAGALVLAAGVLGTRALFRRLRRKAVVAMSPHAAALAALDRLLADNLPAQGRLKAHYDGLAEILRTYLSARFGLPALELTTAELVARMREERFDETLRADVRLVLDEADLVKFARLEVPIDKAFAQAHVVRTVVERTVPAALQAGDAKPHGDQIVQPHAATLPGAGSRSATASGSAPSNARGEA